MPKITFIDKHGVTTAVGVSNGISVMQAAIDNNVAGILGECGGACQCATCHVYVDESWAGRLPPPSDTERGMLEGVSAELRPTSRLGCEIRISAALDGLVLRLPERQI